ELGFEKCALDSSMLGTLFRSLESLNGTLTHFSLNDNPVNDPTAWRGLSSLMQPHNNLKRLKLNHNKLGDDVLRNLRKYLQHCQSLEWLELDGNEITCKGVEDISKCLFYFQMLAFLSLRDNWIGDHGVKNLALGLKTNTITGIYLDNNRITSEGASYIASLL